MASKKCWISPSACSMSPIFYLLLFLAALSHADLTTYNKRAEVLKRMNDTREKYLRTYIYNSDERQKILKSLLNMYKTEFKDSDQWILNAMKSTGSDNIVTETYTKNFFNIEETQRFIKEASTNVLLAFSLNFWCNAIDTRNEQKAIQLRDGANQARHDVQNILTSTVSYLKGGWKEDLKRDVDAWSLSNKDSGSFPNIIVNLLGKKYTNGNWLVLYYNSNEWKTYCFHSGAFHYESTAVSNKRVLVVRSDRNKKLDSSVKTFLNKIKSSGWGFCVDKSAEIISDSGYNCKSGEFTFFGAVTVSGFTKFAVTRRDLYASKQVYRSICKYDYLIIAFA